MIIFVGTKERGFFCEDVASKLGTTCEYVEANIHIENQIKFLLDHIRTVFWVGQQLFRLPIRMLSYWECGLRYFCIVIERA